jgi:hypothetical protein
VSAPTEPAPAPHSPTRAEREAAGDPRLSIEERYPNEAAYVAAVKRSADALARQRYILPEDAAAIIAGAGAKYRAAVAR